MQNSRWLERQRVWHSLIFAFSPPCGSTRSIWHKFVGHMLQHSVWQAASWSAMNADSIVCLLSEHECRAGWRKGDSTAHATPRQLASGTSVNEGNERLDVAPSQGGRPGADEVAGSERRAGRAVPPGRPQRHRQRPVCQSSQAQLLASYQRAREQQQQQQQQQQQGGGSAAAWNAQRQSMYPSGGELLPPPSSCSPCVS